MSAKFQSSWLAITALLFAGDLAARGVPVVPSNDAVILEKLRSSPFDTNNREIQEFRQKLRQDPQNLQLALALARKYIERNRAEADPRYLGYAEAALRPWWDLAEPPVDILILRATTRQSTHNFQNALADLGAALSIDPTNPQAWLIQASILQVQGRYDDAKRSCLSLFRLSSELVAVTCASSLAALNGEAQKSYDLLSRILDKHKTGPIAERVWASTVLAEIASRIGNSLEAERHFKQAIGLDQPDAYLLGAYADFLLDQNRPAEVIVLLKEKTRIDGLLLRLALAERLSAPGSEVLHVQALRDRFDASRRRGDTVHRREEARFVLHLANQPDRALSLAEENWAVQREPADARIYLEAALAARSRHRAEPVLVWLQSTHLEDIEIAALRRRLDQLPASALADSVRLQ